MRKVALVFVLAVFLPSLVLAWLAVRSLRDQQFILERQQSLLYQGVADAKAKDVQDALAEYQHSFAAQVAKLLAKRDPKEITGSFDDTLQREWPLAQVGFCVSLAGEIKAPALYARAEARKFLDDNGRFLANRESVDVYTNPKQLLANANTANYLNAQPQPSSSAQADLQNDTTQRAGFNKLQQRNVFPQQQTLSSQRQEPAEQAQQQFSKAAAAPAEFRQLIGEDNEGALARFVDNKLNVLFWYRPPGDPQLVFGAQIALPRLVEGFFEIESGLGAGQSLHGHRNGQRYFAPPASRKDTHENDQEVRLLQVQGHLQGEAHEADPDEDRRQRGRAGPGSRRAEDHQPHGRFEA